MDNVDEDERIVSVLFSVASSEGGFFARSKECILCLTNKRLAVIYKTEMSASRWQKGVEEQRNAFKYDNNTIRRAYYTIEDLNTDLDYDVNLNIPFSNILDIKIEEKRWAPELRVVFKESKKHQRALNFAIVRTWVRYPLADPIEYEKPNWKPFVDAIRSRL